MEVCQSLKEGERSFRMLTQGPTFGGFLLQHLCGAEAVTLCRWWKWRPSTREPSASAVLWVPGAAEVAGWQLMKPLG